MTVPFKKEKPVRLREFFNSQYQLITIMPSWQLTTVSTYFGQELDDIVFTRYKDILVDPELYLSTLDSWIRTHSLEFDKLYAALIKEYDPLSNYDMIEKEGTGFKEGEKTSTAKRYGVEQSTQTVPDMKTSRYTTTFDNAAEGRLEAYNVQEVVDGTAPQYDNHNAQITRTEQLPDSQNKQGTELTESYEGNVSIDTPTGEITADRGQERELTRSGNIGVTTSQQMLDSEIQLRVNYSFIDIFCKMFARDMTIGVYDI